MDIRREDAGIMNVMKTRKVAQVHCQGGCLTECASGCTGCGSCESVCKKGAVRVWEDKIARVDRRLCVGCGMCVKACPRSVISLTPEYEYIEVRCSCHEPAPAARKMCANSCIGCGVCERVCSSGAAHVRDKLAEIDPERCISCGMCAVKCPRGVIHDVNGIFTAEDIPGPLTQTGREAEKLG